MKIKDLKEKDLIKYLRIYNELNEFEQVTINFIVYKNHLRYLKEYDKTNYDYYYKLFKHNSDNLSFYNINSSNEVINSLEDMVNLFNNIMLGNQNFIEKITSYNSIMIKNGLCPLVLYAFNKLIYKLPLDIVRMRELVEFSVMSLYRVVKINLSSNNLNSQKVNDTGAISDIYLTHNKNLVKKVPKTVASFSFLLQQEYSIAKQLNETAFREYIPTNYKFNYKNKTLVHDYVEGFDGEYYLFNHIKLSKEQVSLLKKLYLCYKNIYNEFILDFHPGNFIWNEKMKKWIIIDLGAIPTIGSDYYIYDTFEEYFENIWLAREMTMKKIPIRSLDFGNDFNIERKVIDE